MTSFEEWFKGLGYKRCTEHEKESMYIAYNASQQNTAERCVEIAAGHKRLSVVDDRLPGGTRPSERVAYDFACGDIADAIRKEFSL